MSDLTLGDILLAAQSRAALLDDYCFGRGFFDPALPHHATPRRCPFCGGVYRVHAGFADHRDRCEAGPNPGSNPAGPPRTDGGHDLDEQADYLAAELSIPEEEARRYLENQRAHGDGGEADD